MSAYTNPAGVDYISNPRTGRLIKVDGKIYKDLIRNGEIKKNEFEIRKKRCEREKKANIKKGELLEKEEIKKRYKKRSEMKTISNRIIDERIVSLLEYKISQNPYNLMCEYLDIKRCGHCCDLSCTFLCCLCGDKNDVKTNIGYCPKCK